MSYLRFLFLGLFLLVFSCEDAAEEVDCAAKSTELLASLEAFNLDPSNTTNCETLKTQAEEFMNNSCDTTGIGDLSFLVDSLDCATMACSVPLGNLLVYGIQMAFAEDSATYCAYFDSTLMAADQLIAGDCWGADSTSYYTAYYDSVEAAGCDWFSLEVSDIVGHWSSIEIGIYSDAETCSGDTMWWPDICEDNMNGDNLDYTDQESCEENGGYWQTSEGEFNLWFNEDMTVTENDCTCEDEYGNEYDNCDWDDVDDLYSDPTGCVSYGGRYESETIGTFEIEDDEIFLTPLDLDDWEGPNPLVFTLEDGVLSFDLGPNPGQCECEDEYGNEIDGCDWDEQDEGTCESSGGNWEDGMCFIILSEKSQP